MEDTAIPSIEPEERVPDNVQDIAINQFLEKLEVGHPGRIKFCFIHVRLGTKGGKLQKTTTSYSAEKDCPHDRTVSIQPTKEEKEGRPNTKRFLVIGIIIASDPDRYCDTGKKEPSQSSARLEAREKRGVNRPEAKILRVVIEATEYIAKNVKYYAVCHEINGLYELRLVNVGQVFFFSEFWTGIPTKAKDRYTELSTNCKTAAATIKKYPQRQQITVTADDKDWKPSDPLSTTPRKDFASMLSSLWTLYQRSYKPEALQAVKSAIERYVPDIQNAPSASTEGCYSFYDFSNPFEVEDAVKVVGEITNRFPDVEPLDASFIVKLRTLLVASHLHGELPYQNLGLFLHWTHEKSKPGWEDHLIVDVLRQVLKDIKSQNMFSYIVPASKLDSVQRDDCLPFISALRNKAITIAQYHRNAALEIRKQHGGLQEGITFDTLMTKISSCADRSALRSYVEQALSLHAEQLVAVDREKAELLDSLVKDFNQFLELEEAKE